MKTIIIMTLCICLSCCNKLFKSKDDFLTIPKTPYTGSQLRLDGYYYQKWDNGLKFRRIIFLYNNGVVFRVGESGDLKDMDNYAVKSLHGMDYSAKKGFWGVFLVKDNKIAYERWVGTERGYMVYKEEGYIKNDTTFVMTEVSRMKQGVKTDTKKIEDVYHFQSFSPKPDSANNFIK